MRQITKDKITKTAGIFAGPAIVFYVILTFVFMSYEPDRFVTVPNDCKGSSCYNFVVTDGPTYLLGPEYDIDYVREPETFQKQVDYMGIGDYMLMIPIVLFFAGCIGLLLFVIIFRGYHSIKDMGHRAKDVWKP
jgi:hypothetical protein